MPVLVAFTSALTSVSENQVDEQQNNGYSYQEDANNVDDKSRLDHLRNRNISTRINDSIRWSRYWHHEAER